MLKPTVQEVPTSLLISLSFKLSSDSEDSSVEVECFEPAFSKYLTADRFNLSVVVGNRNLKFQAQLESYDFNTNIARLTGNSAAWQFNQVRQYRVWQQKPIADILKQLGVLIDTEIPASLLSQPVSLVQNNTTDYRFAYTILSSLGLRLQGSLDGSPKLKAKPLAASTPVLAIGYGLEGNTVVAFTDEPGVSVLRLSLGTEDETESAKDTAGAQTEVAAEAKPKTTAEQSKYIRIDPSTGQRYRSNTDIAPVASSTDAKAKAKQLKWSVELLIDHEQTSEDFLLQPGDVLSLELTDSAGSTSNLGAIVESADYKVSHEHTICSLECSAPKP